MGVCVCLCAGIPKDKQASVFEMFSQVDTSDARGFGGSGIGLAISRLLCRNMGGDISVESDGVSGSTFTVTLLVPLLSKRPLDTDNVLEGASVAILTRAEDTTRGVGGSLEHAGASVVYISEDPFTRPRGGGSSPTNAVRGARMALAKAHSSNNASSAALDVATLQRCIMGRQVAVVDLDCVTVPVAQALLAGDSSCEPPVPPTKLVLVGAPRKWHASPFRGLQGAALASTPVVALQTIAAAYTALHGRSAARPACLDRIDDGDNAALSTEYFDDARSSGGTPKATSSRPTATMAASFGPVLVVEDNKVNRTMLIRMLERSGFTVESAENGKIAVDMVASKEYSVILMDIMVHIAQTVAKGCVVLMMYGRCALSPPFLLHRCL